MKIDNFTKIGKAIVIAGVKSVSLGAGVAVVTAVIQHGADGLKTIKLDDLLK